MSSERPWLEGDFSEYIDRLKRAFRALRDDLQKSQVEPEQIRQLDEVCNHLDELFLLVIVGEFNAGKSALINALFHTKVCPEGPVPTTDKINILKYGPTSTERYRGDYVVERFHPFEPLKSLNIVDTPGTNSIVKQHQEITEDYIPRADLILFVTSLDRPYSASEQRFLKIIADRWRKKIFFVLTKIDMTESEEDIEKVIAFVKENCKSDFGFEPLIIPLSPKLAFKARTEKNTELYRQSRFQGLEDYLFEQLTEADKLSLKIVSPIEAALRICGDVRTEFDARLKMIDEHADTLRRVEKLVNDRARALKDAYNKHLLSITNLLASVENRGVNFFEEKVQISNFMALRDRTKFKLEFEETVVRRFQDELWEILSKATDEVVRAEMSLWGDAFNEYNHQIEKLQRYWAKETSLAKVSTKFEYNRDAIIDAVRRDWERNLNTFNHQEQVHRILDDVGAGLNLVLGTGVGGIGIATIGLLMNSTAEVVVLLLFVGLATATTGIWLFPRRRRKSVKHFKSRFAELRERLIEALQDNIDAEVQQLKGRIFDKLNPAKQRFKELRTETESLRDALDQHTTTMRTIMSDFQNLIANRFPGTHHTLFSAPEPAPTAARSKPASADDSATSDDEASDDVTAPPKAKSAAAAARPAVVADADGDTSRNANDEDDDDRA